MLIEPHAESHRPSSFRLTEIDSPQRMVEAKSVVESSSGIIHIAFRLVNRPTHGPYHSVIMWQTDDSREKFWLDCLNPPKESVPLVEAIVTWSRFAHNAGVLQTATFNTFQVLLPELISIPALCEKGAKHPKELAKRIRGQRCLATCKRVVSGRKDIDECFLFHLALELELAMSCKDWLESRK